MATLNEAALSAICAIQRKPGVIEINKNTFYPVINFKLGMTGGAFRFSRLCVDIAVNTERASNRGLINHFPYPDIPPGLARVWQKNHSW